MRSGMRLILALSLGLLVPAGLTAQASGEGSVSLPYGTVGPGAAVEDLDGNAVDLIDYVEGKDAFDQDNDTNRSELRPAVLGDVFRSNVQFIGTPTSQLVFEPTFASFRLIRSSRMSAGHTRAHSSHPVQRPARWNARTRFHAVLPTVSMAGEIHCGRCFSTMHVSQ